ncbi:MAG: PilZ domain-containing protein [Clostridiales Family XIII bacterium]|jgi:hypothetical protein|nr:PilZ domain-containing protein [Clostridiales Family XIII bacterium]
MAFADKIIKIDVSKQDEGVFASSEDVTLEDNRLILRGRTFGEIPHHTQVDVIAYFEDGLQFMLGVVTLSMAKQINVEIISVADQKQERRRNFKVRTSFDAKVNGMCSLGEKCRKMQMDVPIRVRDLSMGGIGFFCNHTFFRKQRIWLDLSYLKEGFVAEFQILRKERIPAIIAADETSPAARYKFRYGGRILKITAEQERLVCEYVFKVQLSDYHRRKEGHGARRA